MADTLVVGGFQKPSVLGIEKSTTEISSLQAFDIIAVPAGPYTQAVGGFLKPGVPNAPEKSTTELSSLQALNLFTISIGPYTRSVGGFAYTGVPNAPLRLSTFMATSNDPVVISGTAGNVANVVTQTWTVS
jgi:hypothetical protein